MEDGRLDFRNVETIYGLYAYGIHFALCINGSSPISSGFPYTEVKYIQLTVEIKYTSLTLIPLTQS